MCHTHRITWFTACFRLMSELRVRRMLTCCGEGSDTGGGDTGGGDTGGGDTAGAAGTGCISPPRHHLNIARPASGKPISGGVPNVPKLLFDN